MQPQLIKYHVWSNSFNGIDRFCLCKLLMIIFPSVALVKVRDILVGCGTLRPRCGILWWHVIFPSLPGSKNIARRTHIVKFTSVYDFKTKLFAKCYQFPHLICSWTLLPHGTVYTYVYAVYFPTQFILMKARLCRAFVGHSILLSSMTKPYDVCWLKFERNIVNELVISAYLGLYNRH